MWPGPFLTTTTSTHSSYSSSISCLPSLSLSVLLSRRETSPLRTSTQKVGHPSPSLVHGRKTGQPSKKVDLGAAAIFASQAESSARNKPSDSNPPLVGTGGGEDPLLALFGGSSTADQTQLQPVSTQGQ